MDNTIRFLRAPAGAPRYLSLCITLLLLLGLSPGTGAEVLSLPQAVALAQRQDPWLTGNRYRQQSLEAESVAAGTLPDPKLSLGFANVPTDTWDFNQEPMTQFKVGVIQMFPRGEQRSLQRQQLQQRSARLPLERHQRLAQVELTVTRLWLEAWQAQQAIRLIENHRYLFEQMADITQSQYSSALGRTRQQDVIRAQLELTRLEDRLTRLQQQLDTSLARLARWTSQVQQGESGYERVRPSLQLLAELPQIPLRMPDRLLRQPADWPQLADYFLQHPSVQSLAQEIAVSATEVALARQQYRPEWGLNASYGYREDAPMGMERADFFSLGITVDLPLFTGNRQDQQVAAASARQASLQSDKTLQLQKLWARFEAAKAQWLRLEQRQALYRNKLLPQIHQQAEASLTAYTNDNGDFAEVMRDRIAELNARIDMLTISAEQRLAVAQLNYCFTGVADRALEDSSHE